MVSENLPFTGLVLTRVLCADPGISSCVEELFEALSVNPGIHTSLHSHLIPLSVEILSGTSQSLGLVAVCVSACPMCGENHLSLQVLLDVLVHVIRGCVVQMSSGIPSPFIQQVFPNAVKRVVSSSDSAVLQVCV